MTAPATLRLLACTECPGAALAALRRAAAEAAPQGAELVETGCMNACARGPALAFRAEGRMTYLFGGVTAEDMPAVLTFLRLYRDAPGGVIADARPLGPLRFRLIARIPS